MCQLSDTHVELKVRDLPVFNFGLQDIKQHIVFIYWAPKLCSDEKTPQNVLIRRNCIYHKYTHSCLRDCLQRVTNQQQSSFRILVELQALYKNRFITDPGTTRRSRSIIRRMILEQVFAWNMWQVRSSRTIFVNSFRPASVCTLYPLSYLLVVHWSAANCVGEDVINQHMAQRLACFALTL